MKNVCHLKYFEGQGYAYESSISTQQTGKLIPKDGETFHVVISIDNPDIQSHVTEKRLTEQACKESEKQIGYNLKIYSAIEIGRPDDPDVTIRFANNDTYFQPNTLAYAGYPNGSFKGKVVFNNKFIWLDGYDRTKEELEALGLAQPGMISGRNYMTYNYRQTIKHELCGHVFGLEHTTDETDVMHPYYREDRLMFGNLSKDTLNDKYGNAGFIKRLLPDSYIKSVMSRRL